MRQPIRPLIELRVGQPLVAAHDRLSIRHRVCHGLEQVGQVEFHRTELEHVLILGRKRERRLGDGQGVADLAGLKTRDG
jgi:hypothetical protein